MMKLVIGDQFYEPTDLVLNRLLDQFEEITDLMFKSVIGDRFDVDTDLLSKSVHVDRFTTTPIY